MPSHAQNVEVQILFTLEIRYFIQASSTFTDAVTSVSHPFAIAPKGKVIWESTRTQSMQMEILFRELATMWISYQLANYLQKHFLKWIFLASKPDKNFIRQKETETVWNALQTCNRDTQIKYSILTENS